LGNSVIIINPKQTLCTFIYKTHSGCCEAGATGTITNRWPNKFTSLSKIGGPWRLAKANEFNIKTTEQSNKNTMFDRSQTGRNYSGVLIGKARVKFSS
jgi:hypothetical protein